MSFAPTSSAIALRLAALRHAMRRHDIDACIVPSSDPHLSEYLPERWKGREYLSGFTGSGGTLVATSGFVGIWTDARYWTQAQAELDGTGIALMKSSGPAGQHYIDWLAANVPSGGTVAVDTHVLGAVLARTLRQTLGAHDLRLRTDLDVLDDAWPDRPALPSAPVFEHLPPHAGLGRAGKLAAVRAAMDDVGASHHFISTLDDIAYLFNLRGTDVDFNPVFLAHALVGPQRTTLFVDAGKVASELSARLEADGIDLAPYAHAAQSLMALPAGGTLLVDPRRVTAGMCEAIDPSMRVIETVNPTTLAKSRKLDSEIAGIRAVMEHDGAALCEFFSWLESQLGDSACALLDEIDIDTHLTAARARRPNFVGPSFATIAGFNANSAIVHYRAVPKSCAVLAGNGLLLIDSGGQYLNGTTDITRVVPVGKLSDEQKRDCTLVLRGLIGLSCAHFPRGTRSPMLDALARAPIWGAGIDYGHGTGHGVGYFLNVHEGPQMISPSAPPDRHTAMEPGMITSIEPGIYRPGRWGVRIENLVFNARAGITEYGEFLTFETLTLCPIDSRCLDITLLRPEEIAWLNDYHATVRARLAPHVDGLAAEWLIKRTEPV